jgi:hypothetical protein
LVRDAREDFGLREALMIGPFTAPSWNDGSCAQLPLTTFDRTLHLAMAVQIAG